MASNNLDDLLPEMDGKLNAIVDWILAGIPGALPGNNGAASLGYTP